MLHEAPCGRLPSEEACTLVPVWARYNMQIFVLQACILMMDLQPSSCIRSPLAGTHHRTLNILRINPLIVPFTALRKIGVVCLSSSVEGGSHPCSTLSHLGFGLPHPIR